MRCLAPTGQDRQWIKVMNPLRKTDMARRARRSVTSETTAGTDSLPLEVNVIFTEPQATSAALKAAESFARGLGACVRLRAAITVPWQLPLDQPPVSVSFFAQILRDLVDQQNPDALERTVHLYICRAWAETLLEVLRPNSVVVIGGRKHWWPTAESRLARALRAKGHQVVLVDFGRQLAGRVM
jgi:hypothetical protein